MGIMDILRRHPALSGGAVGVVIGGGITNIIGRIRSRRKKTKRKASSSTRRRKNRKRGTTTRKRSSSFKSRRKRAFASASSKKIRMTKNGQPFIILASGKARFISKKSAKSRRMRKGGFS